VTQDAKAKSEIFTRIRRIVRRGDLDYDGWRYVAKRVRKECSLQPARKGRRLPKVLTGDDFRRFFEALDRSEDVQHSLMIRLLFYSGMRVSELCNTQVADVDLEACHGLLATVRSRRRDIEDCVAPFDTFCRRIDQKLHGGGVRWRKGVRHSATLTRARETTQRLKGNSQGALSRT
jgi:hypothetical protein